MSGKVYNGEKAIISLTSWKARINTVVKTLYSIYTQCPGFHIVLVLSEEEFPKKEDELPENLMLFVENDIIELLWVYKNYKSFKKVLFTMDKYREVPVISADDGCIYTKNFAQPLYDLWSSHKSNIICNVYWYNSFAPGCGGGSGVLFPPNCFNTLGLDTLKLFYKDLMKNPNDDRFIANLAKFCNIKILKTKNITNVFADTDVKFAMGATRKYIIGSNWRFFEFIKRTSEATIGTSH